MKRTATLIVGRNRISVHIDVDGVDQGGWLRLHESDTYVRSEVTDSRPYLSHDTLEAHGAPDSGLYLANTRPGEDPQLPTFAIEQFICASPTDGTRVDGVWIERFRTPQWKHDCSEVAHAIAQLILDARLRVGIGKVRKLHIVYTNSSHYLPNIFCNAIGKALGMRSAVKSVAVKHAYGWDERPLFDIRRSHVSDWFRSTEGSFLMLTDPGHRDDTSGNELWVWHKEGRLTVQNETSETESFRDLTERLDQRDQDNEPADNFDRGNLTSAVGRRLGQALHDRQVDASLAKDLDELGVSHVFIDHADTVKDVPHGPLGVWQIGAGPVVKQ